MELHNAIARWESEGGAIPQVQRSRKPEREEIKPLTIRRILVPIDFSPESLKALRYAKRLVERFKAKLHMVHVVTPPLVLFPQPRQVLPRNFTEEMVGNAIDRFEEVVRDFSLPLRHRHHTVRIGAVAQEINEVARITRTDFIAIATRGYSGLKRAFLGSTTESVVRNARCPVLVVREKDGSTGSRGRKGPLQFRKILVPLDFSEASRLGLEYALSFAEQFHATVLLFHSISVSAYVMGNRYTAHHVPTQIANQQECVRREMEELREAILRKGGVAEIKIAVGSAVEQIGKYVRKAGVDLIITSTHGRTGLRRVFIGSTPERLVRHATCPVLVVPNRAAGKKMRGKRGS
jgi:nucleotide-binding universal stress UspA family protein